MGIIKVIKLDVFILLGYWKHTEESLLVYIHCPERTGFNMYAESTQQQLTFLALGPCLYILYVVEPIYLYENIDS